jgi:hypothetical protein
MKNKKKNEGIYYSGCSQNFSLKPFARHGLAIELWRRSTFISNIAYRVTY